MNTWLAVLSPFLVGILGLVMFTTWFTAVIFVAFLGVVSAFAIRFYDKHHRPYQLDEKLPESRQAQAIVEYIEMMEVKKKNVED